MAKDNDGKGRKLLERVGSLFEKEEPEWDDGTNKDREDEGEAGGRKVSMIMLAFGIFMGSTGCQYCKYLHQCFACKAWGIELTSRHVRPYGIPQLAQDAICGMVVYALICTLGALVNVVLRHIYLKGAAEEKELSDRALMYGFLALLCATIVFLVLPFNIFLIGVP